MATPEQQKWVAKLLGYNYEIIYYPGRENSATDALSRKQRNTILHHIFIPQLHPHRQQTTFKGVHQKLAGQFYGPYQILEKIKPVAYKLQLPNEARIHLVLHVSLLKRYKDNGGNAEAKRAELPPVTDEGVVVLEPQTILDTCWIKQGTQLVEESLVQWKHLPSDEATWESMKQLLDMFPPMDLEDKDPLDRGSIVRPHHSKRGIKPNPKHQG
ncbi:hypothetical protein F0562_012389 [Nyssa sinensis]|uniref:Uncharacterized protein n=1 Tax=Nyssa sinensis TaxID=561372 RepID=A0A5J4ZVD7_9ASTE|nr:hypothetical protein F0562_012389 [Nyssa sinensis]